MLGIPVVPISAAKNEGIDELDQPCHPCGKISGTAQTAWIFVMQMTMAVQYTDAFMQSCI